MRHVIFSCLAGLACILFFASESFAQVEVGFGGEERDSDEPIEVVSDTLSVDQDTGEAIFTGNVVVVQGDLRMAAARVRVTYSDTDTGREMDEMFATGGVLITQGEDAAEGNDARYDVISGMLRMTGNVLVTQGNATVAGDVFVMDMETGNGTVEGRVRTLLETGGDDE